MFQIQTAPSAWPDAIMVPQDENVTGQAELNLFCWNVRNIVPVCTSQTFIVLCLSTDTRKSSSGEKATEDMESCSSKVARFTPVMASKTFMQHSPWAAIKAPLGENTTAFTLSPTATGMILMQASQVGPTALTSFVSVINSHSYSCLMDEDVGVQGNAEWYMCIADCLTPSKDRSTNLSQSSINSDRSWSGFLV